MNATTTRISKALVTAIVGLTTATVISAAGGSAHAAVMPTTKPKATKAKTVVTEINRNYGVDNVMANRFDVLWHVTRVLDSAGAPKRFVSAKNAYCQVLPSVLGWTGKGSCTVKRIASGHMLTNIAIFRSPRVCVANTCTPSVTMTFGSRIYFDKSGDFTREEFIGNSA